MAIATDVRDCAPRGRGLGGSLKGPGVPPGARPLTPERCNTSPQPSRGMPRFHQVRRIRGQEADRIARNVRALSEWAFRAPADAASLLGRRPSFRGKLEAVGVGKNLVRTRGQRKFKRRIQPFLTCGLVNAFRETATTSCGRRFVTAALRVKNNIVWIHGSKCPINPRRLIPEKRDLDLR